MGWRDVVGIIEVLAVAIAAWLFITTSVRAEARYDPTSDPNVRSYMVCIQLASGGGDNSLVPDVSVFDEYGYVLWNDGTGKAILCQNVEKPA